MVRYLITDGSSALDEKAWLNHLTGWMERGVDFIQIRERDVSARVLATLTRRILGRRDALRSKTRILVNDRTDIALSCAADGIHLRDGSIPAELLTRTGWIITVSCHDPTEVDTRRADLILLAPIFSPLSKSGTNRALGPEALRVAAALTSTPILALGGVTRGNEHECIAAGAAGIAGITYFSDAATIRRRVTY